MLSLAAYLAQRWAGKRVCFLEPLLRSRDAVYRGRSKWPGLSSTVPAAGVCACRGGRSGVPNLRSKSTSVTFRRGSTSYLVCILGLVRPPRYGTISHQYLFSLCPFSLTYFQLFLIIVPARVCLSLLYLTSTSTPSGFGFSSSVGTPYILCERTDCPGSGNASASLTAFSGEHSFPAAAARRCYPYVLQLRTSTPRTASEGMWPYIHVIHCMTRCPFHSKGVHSVPPSDGSGGRQSSGPASQRQFPLVPAF